MVTTINFLLFIIITAIIAINLKKQQKNFKFQQKY